MSNAAALIRKDLQAAGFALRSFSIRTCRTGSVSIQIKDGSIGKAAVTEIARRHEQVRRDEGGEILAGGNIFVTVRYAEGALAGAAEQLAARMQAGERVFAGVHVDAQESSGLGLHMWHVWTNGDVGRHLRMIAPCDGRALAEVLAERGELEAALWAGRR